MRKNTVTGGRGRFRLFLLEHDGPTGNSFLVPIIVTISVVMFIITMYVNNCPQNNGGNCTIGFLGRLSFQPMSDNPLLGPSSSALSKMGGLTLYKVAHSHHLWRPVTCVWLHAGCIHLIVDIMSVLFVGIRFEQEFGTRKVGSIYILSGIGGSLFSALFVENRVSVGSSAATFGLIGAIVSEILPNWNVYSRKFSTLTTLMLLALVNLIVGIFPHIDNFGNIGGFLFGFFLGFIFLLHPHIDWAHQTITPPSRASESSTAPKHKVLHVLLWAMAVIVLAVGYIVLMVLALRGVNADNVCGWCRSFSCVPSPKWKCDDGHDARKICRYVIAGDTLVLTCEATQRSQMYAGYYTASSLRQLCADLCSMQ